MLVTKFIDLQMLKELKVLVSVRPDFFTREASLLETISKFLHSKTYQLAVYFFNDFSNEKYFLKNKLDF